MTSIVLQHYECDVFVCAKWWSKQQNYGLRIFVGAPHEETRTAHDTNLPSNLAPIQT